MTGLSEAARKAIEQAKYRVVDRAANPLLDTLPGWVESYRPHQVEAISQVVDAFTRVPVVVLDAPTGSGKTLIGETARRMLQTQALYVCSSKSLQDQFLTDYPYAKVLKGRSNYPTQGRPHLFPEVSADDCTWSMGNSCRWCAAKSMCPYEMAKKDALGADVAVLNTSYFLTEANYIGKFSGVDLVVADEADELESALMNHVSIYISERRLAQWGWDPPDKVTVAESWRGWLDDKIGRLLLLSRRLPETEDPKIEKERKYMADLRAKMRMVLGGLDTGAWVYTGRAQDDKKGRLGVSFKPSRVDFLGQDMLWQHGNRWLLMSATIISAEHMLSTIGYNGDFELVKVRNTFPVTNRRVVVKPVANMASKHSEESWPKITAACVEIANDNADHRILIHSVSYNLTRHVVEGLRAATNREVATYTNADGRADALERYRRSPGAILVAPSFSRGIDLPGDLCRVQILTKVPYPYLGDRQVAARLYSGRDGRTWYAVNTIRDMVQACGRAVRSNSDWAVTYILDSQFKDKLWNEGRGLFPQWFIEAIQW